MSRSSLGLLFCLSFVTLEAFQAVYLGALFQSADSFLIGACVFGICVVGCTLVTAIRRPIELRASRREWRIAVALNMLAAVTWVTYFTAVQLIEPAIVFTIFSGMVPLGTVVASRFGMPEALSAKRRFAALGNLIILLSLLALAAVSMFGWSGFVRGDAATAFAGVALSAISGGCTAFVILYSVRLNRRGVGPLAQFGLRFILYCALATVAFAAGMDDKGTSMAPLELAMIVLIGLGVIAFPLYLVQRAVPLLHASVIAAMTALGPLMVFVMQLLEGRVDYSPATLSGLTLYMTGALLGVAGAVRSVHAQV